MRTFVLLLIAVSVAGGCARTIITSPTPTAADAATLLREFSSQLLPGASASRTFDVASPGQVAVTLTSTTPGGVSVGLGVGIPRTDGSCALSAAVQVVAGATAQLAMPADAGEYCAKVFDLGTLAAPLPFTISISRP